MIRSRAFLLGAGLALLAAHPSRADETFPVDHKEPISVRVLGGKDGKPLAHAHLILTLGYERRDLEHRLWQEEALTDEHGDARLTAVLANLAYLRVSVTKKHLCQADSQAASFSVERIRRDGLSTPNRCGTATVAEAPGVFTVFVKGKGTPANAAARPPAVQAVPATAAAPVSAPTLALAPAPVAAPVSAPALALAPAPVAAPVSAPALAHAPATAAASVSAPALALAPATAATPVSAPALAHAPATAAAPVSAPALALAPATAAAPVSAPALALAPATAAAPVSASALALAPATAAAPASAPALALAPAPVAAPASGPAPLSTPPPQVVFRTKRGWSLRICFFCSVGLQPPGSLR